jgi:TPR repeat protein
MQLTQRRQAIMTRLAALILMVLTTAYADVDAAWRAYDAGDFQDALREALPLAQRGDPKAQQLVGMLYGNGQGVAKDYTEARRWFLKAADQGNARAQYDLGYMYANGQGVRQDYAEASKWYGKAAEQGSAKGQYGLGYLYASGQGVTQDQAEAAKWVRRAAEQGNAQAQGALGYMYSVGQGVPRDIKEAKKWYGLAAEEGDENAKKALTQLSEISQASKPLTHDLRGLAGGSLLWADSESGEYSFTLFNNRSEAIKNVSLEIVFHDIAGNAIDTDLIRYDGIIPAGRSKRLASKVDLSVRRLSTKEFRLLGRNGKPVFELEPNTRIEYVVVDFEIVH